MRRLSGAVSSTTKKTAANNERPVILVLGDSLSAEYGLQRGQGWVQLLANRLQQNGSNYTVVNASISGDTTSGGTRTIARAAEAASTVDRHHRARRQRRVARIAGGSHARQSGQRWFAPARQRERASWWPEFEYQPNYGREYTERFYDAFANVSKEHNTALVPFLLEGFTGFGGFFSGRPDSSERTGAEPNSANGLAGT